MRAARLPTAKVPKPTRDTELPFFNVALTAPIVDSSARVAAAFEISAFFFFFDEGLLSSMSYNHISPKRYIIVAAADFCMSFDRRYAENPEADTIAPLDISLSYPRESFATITRCKRYRHAEL